MRKQRYWLYRRGGIYYIHDSETGVRESLETRIKQEAEHIRQTRNMTAARPVIGMSLAKAYLTSQDPNLLKRTWQDVVDEFCSRGSEETQKHRRRVSKRRPQNLLLGMKLLETTNEDLMKVLKAGGVMTNAFVRCLHNLALGLGWLAWPILPPKLWPTVETKPKRAVTREEHERIIAAETNADRRKYYQLLWETGAAQTDAALLRSLPSEGLLLPKIAKSNASARSSEFCRRCRLLEIKGVSLHSYRYAWAQRAKACGYEQRWAQNALGHDSEAVHEAYAAGAVALCPPLDEYEEKIVQLTANAATTVSATAQQPQPAQIATAAA